MIDIQLICLLIISRVDLDYFSHSSCPGSPNLPDKHHLSSSATNATTLSPPGFPLTSSASSLGGTGKRRGIGHRASHKRAHTGRAVSICLFLFYKTFLLIIIV